MKVTLTDVLATAARFNTGNESAVLMNLTAFPAGNPAVWQEQLIALGKSTWWNYQDAQHEVVRQVAFAWWSSIFSEKLVSSGWYSPEEAMIQAKVWEVLSETTTPEAAAEYELNLKNKK